MRIVHGNHGLLVLVLYRQPMAHGMKRYVLVQPNVPKGFLYEKATLNLRESLKKDFVTELEEMVDECSLDEGQFPFAFDDKWRGLVNKSGFYIQGNILVIDDARMRQHSKIIIKNVIN